jgi:hypothetical protein
LNFAAPFRFAFLSAFSVPRSKHPPSDARSPFRNPLCASQEVRTPSPGELWSPSADPVQSPWEWVAMAHPPGKHVPQTAPRSDERQRHCGLREELSPIPLDLCTVGQLGVWQRFRRKWAIWGGGTSTDLQVHLHAACIVNNLWTPRYRSPFLFIIL